MRARCLKISVHTGGFYFACKKREEGGETGENAEQREIQGIYTAVIDTVCKIIG